MFDVTRRKETLPATSRMGVRCHRRVFPLLAMLQWVFNITRRHSPPCDVMAVVVSVKCCVVSYKYNIID